MPVDQQLRLSIGLPLRDPAALAQFIKRLYDPTKPDYRRFLSSQEFTVRFGPQAQDYRNVAQFFATNGFRIEATHANRLVLDVTGSAADIERTLKVRLKFYRHPDELWTFFAPDTEPTVPRWLSVLHIAGLDDYQRPRPAGLRPQSGDSSSGGPRPLNGSGPRGTYRGWDFRAAYAPGIAAALNGAGQKVALVQFDGYYPADISAYETACGLPSVPLINIQLDNASGVPGPYEREVALDIEMCVSMAPGLDRIFVYEGQVPNSVLNRIATDNLAAQISSSWFFATDPTTTQIFQEFAAQGQSYFNASGDQDAYVGPALTPCDHPWVTSVGGTMLLTDPSGAYVSEQAWNANNGCGTGGGISTTYPIPDWQQAIDMSVNQGSTHMRNVPDVAMIADDVWIICGNGQGDTVAGTSVAAPLWAAFTALINQQAAARAQPRIGFINPAIYSVGTGPGYTNTFHDVQVGNNTSSSSPSRFLAMPGYDLCTGWGSPNGTNLIEALAPALSRPFVTNDSVVLIAESCLPTNGIIDPGETVTIKFGLKNIGGIDTTDLVATLEIGGGVIQPSAPQSYGVLAGGGVAASRAFTFTANAACGSTVTATLQLRDGSNSMGKVSFPLSIGNPVVRFSETFDAVAAGLLPDGWSSLVSDMGSNWVTTSVSADTSPNAAFAFESFYTGVADLISPGIPISTAMARFRFRQFFNLECHPAVETTAYDGGILEIKIGAADFEDILAAGGSFITNGYNMVIDVTDDNPLVGRQCWSGLSDGFIETVVNLPAAAAGKTIQLKWRLATNTANYEGRGGWYIDGITVQDSAQCCLPVPTIEAVALLGPGVTVSVPTVAGVNYALQYKDSMADLPWTTMAPPAVGTGGIVRLVDTNPPVLPSRFYRVIAY